MGIKIRDHLDVSNLDFSDMKLFREYIEEENLKYDIEQLKKETVKLTDLKMNNENMNIKKQYKKDELWEEYTNENFHDMFYVNYNISRETKYNKFDEETDKAA